MKTTTLRGMILGLALIALAVPGFAADEPPAGAPKSLRGDTPVESTSNIDLYRWEKETGKPIPRDFVQQPPLIPHSIKGYQITMNFNKCMDCHSWSRAPETKATKVSLTHFKDREGKELSNISPRRYFCLQCHVPQTDATPLVNNEFKPVKGVAPQK